jgi:hypothetical protein
MKAMRRAGQKGIVSLPTTFVAPPAEKRARGSVAVELDVRNVSMSTVDPVPAESPLSSHGAFISDSAVSRDRGDRQCELTVAIRKRIESRLAGRVRNLVVRVFDDTVVLEGACATYYTKQLAQHAALGILEDEHLENAIVVDVPR